MAYTLIYTGQFKKDLKRCQKRGLDIELLHKVITLLQENGSLPAEYKPRILGVSYKAGLVVDMGAE